MATKQINLGKVVLTPRGEYDPQYTYEQLDIISYQGSSWLVLTPFKGVTPGLENESVMLLAAKGDTGKVLIFDELTPLQQEALRGEKGEEGKGFVILGHYNTLSELEMQEVNPDAGDAYAIGNNPPYDIYIYDSMDGIWMNNGNLQGPAGYSAYEIAVAGGFEGTEEEWLLHLKPDVEKLALKEELIPITESLGNVTEQLQQTKERIEQRIDTVEEEYATKEEVQDKIDLFGRVFRLRGTIEKEEDLETVENPMDGDVVLVRIDSNDEFNKFKGYVYIEEEEKWELIGSTSLDDLYTKEEIDKLIEDCTKIAETRVFSTTNSIEVGQNVYVRKSKSGSIWDENNGAVLGSGELYLIREASNLGGAIIFGQPSLTSGYTSKIQESEGSKLNYSSGSHSFTGNIYNNGSIVAGVSLFSGGKTNSTDGIPGGVLTSSGGLELSANQPYIDFHYANSTEDYTSRIIEQSAKQLNILAEGGLMLNNYYLPINRNNTGLSVTGTSAGITTEQFVTILKSKLPWNQMLNGILRGSWSYAANDYITTTDTGLPYIIPLAGATVEVFKTNESDVNYTIRVTTANSSNLDSRATMRTFIYNNQGTGYVPKWTALPRYNETPQFGVHRDVNSLEIELGTTYSIRYAYNSVAATKMLVLDGGVDGHEYLITINNITGTGTLKINLSTSGTYQVIPAGVTSYEVPAGKVGEISVRYILGRYLIRV